jgi:hypothetical protein
MPGSMGMSHEGTTGMVADAVATEVRAIVQALVSEPTAPAAGAQLALPKPRTGR